MKQANQELRKVIKQSGIRHWQIADKLGVSANTLCLWLRHELPQDKEEAVFNAILEIQESED